MLLKGDAVTVIAAREDGKAKLGDTVIHSRRRLRSADRALVG